MKNDVEKLRELQEASKDIVHVIETALKLEGIEAGFALLCFDLESPVFTMASDIERGDVILAMKQLISNYEKLGVTSSPTGPAPPMRVVEPLHDMEVEPELVLPGDVQKLIQENGLVAVYIPVKPVGIRFFVQPLAPESAETLAKIMEDTAVTVRAMFGPKGMVQ